MFSVSYELRVKKQLIIDHNTTYHNQMATLSIGYMNIWFTPRISNRTLSYGQIIVNIYFGMTTFLIGILRRYF
jgi:hypothetical protein